MALLDASFNNSVVHIRGERDLLQELSRGTCTEQKESDVYICFHHLFRLIKCYTHCNSALELELLLIDRSAPDYMERVTKIIHDIPPQKRSTSFNLLRHSYCISEACRSSLISHHNWSSIFASDESADMDDVEALLFQAKSKKYSGDLKASLGLLTMALKLDPTDRFIASKCAKYSLRLMDLNGALGFFQVAFYVM